MTGQSRHPPYRKCFLVLPGKSGLRKTLSRVSDMFLLYDAAHVELHDFQAMSLTHLLFRPPFASLRLRSLFSMESAHWYPSLELVTGTLLGVTRSHEALPLRPRLSDVRAQRSCLRTVAYSGRGGRLLVCFSPLFLAYLLPLRVL